LLGQRVDALACGYADCNDDDGAGTSGNDVVDLATGCSLAQLCPCDAPRGSDKPWKNHGKYVSCFAHAAKDFVDAGVISSVEKSDLVSPAAGSERGT